MTIQEIVDYVIQTPENSNPAVLKDMLNQLSNPGPSGDSTLIVNLIQDSENPDIVTWDKTAGEVFSAIEQKIIILKFNNETNTNYASLIGVTHDNSLETQYQFFSSDDKLYEASSSTDYPELSTQD